MAFVCLSCNKQYDVGYLNSVNGKFYCPNKNCKTQLEDIDDMLVPISVILFENGFKILDSCSGHLSNNEVQEVCTYIKFSRYCKGLYIDEKHLRTLINGIDSKSDIWYNESIIVIMLKDKDVNYKNVFCKIAEHCNILLEWGLTSVCEFCKTIDSAWCEGEEESEDSEN